ncbi:universal stress protein [uncultured Aquimarina sp.]|uniref:universal stress protein n=1 Tax=uncultured Aquimarina sp. TaxID=575652 RepID=UPI00262848D5|nr:universal stress protein [uncultured Aquimarina sp.]
MKNQDHKNKYQLLVLIDLTKKSYTALKNAINLAKVMRGTIEVFHVSPPADVVKYENQLSAMRAISEIHTTTEKKLQDLILEISEEENVAITYKFTFGNVKNEIHNYIQKTNPDIVVIGKREKKIINFLEDGVTKFLLKKHSGIIMIAGNERTIQSNSNISLGFYNNNNNVIDKNTIQFVKDLHEQPRKPIKFFSIRKRSAAEKAKLTISRIKTACNLMNAVEYEFEESPYSINGLTTYVSKNNVELLCMGRFSDTKGWLNRLINRKSSMGNVIEKLNISLLVTGGK